MTNNCLITICTSFYNVEKYMESFISQLKNQTCPDFICILVDDGSTDKSYKNCVKAIGDDERFSVIKHEKNKGIGEGRITCIENCKTEYITFLDADDDFEKNLVENLLKDINSTNSDLITYEHFTKSEKGEITRLSTEVNSANDLFSKKVGLISHLWNKVFNINLFKTFDLSFCKTVSFAEDLWLCTNCFLNAQNPVIIHNAYYYYKYNSNSLVHKRSEKSIRENIEVLKNLLQNPKLKENKEIEAYIKDDSFHAFGHLIFPSKTNDFQRKPHFDEWRKIDSEIGIFLPEYLSGFVRKYIVQIRKRNDIIANIMRIVIEIKQNKLISKILYRNTREGGG